MPSAPWTEAEKTALRLLLGFPRVFTQYDSRAEQAISAVQTLDRESDMAAVRSALLKIAALDDEIDSLLCETGDVSTGGGGVTIESDAFRQIQTIERRVRQLIHRIEVALGITAQRDYYTGEKLEGYYTNSPFIWQGA